MDARQEAEIKELAKRIYHSIDADFGYIIASDMGMDAGSFDRDTLAKIAQAYAASPKPKQTSCYECGQLLPIE